MKNKRGQFYLIASFIIISLLIGFVSVKNYSQTAPVKIYDISEELNIESAQVIEYGIVQDVQVSDLLGDFSQKYSDYTGKELDELYFVYGDSEEVVIVTYKEVSTGSISLGNYKTEIATSKTEVSRSSNPGQKVEISLDNKKYDFELKQGQNFYYIIQKETENEVYSITNK